MLNSGDLYRVFVIIVVLVWSEIGLAQDTNDVSNSDKARFLVGQLRVRRYRTIPYETRAYIFQGSAGTEFFSGVALESGIIRLDENRLVASFSLVSSFQDSTARLMNFMLKYDTPYGYHHIEYGVALTARTGISKGFWPNLYLGYKFHNPTKRLAVILGIGFHPGKDTDLLWPQLGFGYAFNVLKKRKDVPWK